MQKGARLAEDMAGVSQHLDGSDGALAALRQAARRLDRVAHEHEALASALAALDRAVIGTLKEVDENGATEVSVGVFDLRSGKRLSSRKVVYQGDEYGQLKNEVGRLVNALLNAADGPKETAVRSSDPLDRTNGMEDWSGEDKGGKVQKKKGAGDPLDGVSGMEDW